MLERPELPSLHSNALWVWLPGLQMEGRKHEISHSQELRTHSFLKTLWETPLRLCQQRSFRWTVDAGLIAHVPGGHCGRIPQNPSLRAEIEKFLHFLLKVSLRNEALHSPSLASSVSPTARYVERTSESKFRLCKSGGLVQILPRSTAKCSTRNPRRAPARPSRTCTAR